jgi:trimeric autotransporter adhesin
VNYILLHMILYVQEGVKRVLPRLAEDHGNARRLADGIAALDASALLRCDPATVQTNIVLTELGPTLLSQSVTAADVVAKLKRRGLLVVAMSDTTVRFVTHYGISASDVTRAVSAVKDCLSSYMKAATQQQQQQQAAVASAAAAAAATTAAASSVTDAVPTAAASSTTTASSTTNASSSESTYVNGDAPQAAPVTPAPATVEVLETRPPAVSGAADSDSDSDDDAPSAFDDDSSSVLFDEEPAAQQIADASTQLQSLAAAAAEEDATAAVEAVTAAISAATAEVLVTRPAAEPGAVINAVAVVAAGKARDELLAQQQQQALTDSDVLLQSSAAPVYEEMEIAGMAVSSMGFVTVLASKPGGSGRALVVPITPADPMSAGLDTQEPGTPEAITLLQLMQGIDMGSFLPLDTLATRFKVRAPPVLQSIQLHEVRPKRGCVRVTVCGAVAPTHQQQQLSAAAAAAQAAIIDDTAAALQEELVFSDREPMPGDVAAAIAARSDATAAAAAAAAAASAAEDAASTSSSSGYGSGSSNGSSSDEPVTEKLLQFSCKSGFEAMALALRYPDAKILVSPEILWPQEGGTATECDFSLSADDVDVRFPNLMRLEAARTKRFATDTQLEVDFEAASSFTLAIDDALISQ